MRTRIKFCGCTSIRDARAAVECGVDAIGVIFAPMSPRCVSLPTAREIAQAVPAFVSLVGVFVEPSAAQVGAARDAGYVPQFSGNESAPRCESYAAGTYIKVHHLAPGSFNSNDAPAARYASDAPAFDRLTRDYPNATWMFDTASSEKHGGTGRTFDWTAARALAGDRSIIISGGLSADNVAACIRAVRPYGVDVRSGIETDGVKDLQKMRAFVRAVKEADAQT